MSDSKEEIRYKQALVELLTKMADDSFILGHRISEWTGIGPTLEEDITFGSIAQDKVGQSHNLYQIIAQNIENQTPDKLAFNRDIELFKCSHLVEFPNSQYDHALVRHFLFDHADFIRYEFLMESSCEPLSKLAKKFRSEIKYHIFHANTWMKQLSFSGDSSAKERIQNQLNELYPHALGLFELSPLEDDIINLQIFKGEKSLYERWKEHVDMLLLGYGYEIPTLETQPIFEKGGRNGIHTKFLAPLLSEMREVFLLDADAEW